MKSSSRNQTVSILSAGSCGLAALCLLLFAGCGAPTSTGTGGPDLTGTWLGTLDTGTVQLRVVYNITRNADGTYAATSDSPDQSAFGMPVTRIEITGSRVRIVQEALVAVYSATLSEDGNSMGGVFAQGGSTLTLTIERQSAPLTYTRPQDPVPPLPYETLDLTFPGGAAGVTLAGTLAWPRGDGPFPAVVFVTGSGPQNRNEELMNHRPFLVLADALARAGIASLRYDDRGFAASTGDFGTATTADFAADANAAVRSLRTQTSFRTGALGVIGHSEGGIIAPLAAETDPGIAFIVLLAGTGVNGERVLLSQTRAIAAASGVPAEQLDQIDALNGRVYEIVRTTPDDAEASRLLSEVLLGAGLPQEQLDTQIRQVLSPWMRSFMTFDPIPVLRRLRIPVLALNGTLDLQVLSGINLPPIREALQAAGHPRSEVRELAGLNHLFQHATTGLVAEYATIEETMSPEVLTIVAEWINGLSED